MNNRALYPNFHLNLSEIQISTMAWKAVQGWASLLLTFINFSTIFYLNHSAIP